MPIDAGSIFGTRAEQYDQIRPDYPAGAVRAVTRDLGLTGPAVDLGCGTGKFGAALAAEGLSVLGIEPDARMAVLARRRIPVRVTSFERWAAPAEHYGVVASGQAWHWLCPIHRVVKSNRCLRPGGHVVLSWNLRSNQEQVDRMLAPVYRRLPPRWDEAARRSEARAPIDLDLFSRELTAHGFGAPRRYRFPWTRRYAAGEWCALLATESRYLALSPALREPLFRTLARFIDDECGGGVVSEYACLFLTARKRG